ncbi:MAG: hypothetical protein K9L17_08965 [Clostridiales bacterium]|nr:hypothetical protein [Clostridiales bacterium]MCF8022807.1 hypothetical protein [Clostridiales bacterium]
MSGENTCNKLKRASVWLSKMNVNCYELVQAGQYKKVIRKNSINLIYQTEKEIQLRAIEDIKFEPDSGPFELYLEVDGIFYVEDPPLEKDLTQEDVEEIGENLLLSYAASVIASTTQLMKVTPLVLPPLLERDEE